MIDKHPESFIGKINVCNHKVCFIHTSRLILNPEDEDEAITNDEDFIRVVDDLNTFSEEEFLVELEYD